MTVSDKLKFLMKADYTTITISFKLEDFDSQNTEADINTELKKKVKLNQLSLNAQKISSCCFIESRNM